VTRNGLGDGGHRLHEWALTPTADREAIAGRLAGVNGQVVDEFMATGAVVAGAAPPLQGGVARLGSRTQGQTYDSG
jgi:hypothetical protein